MTLFNKPAMLAALMIPAAAFAGIDVGQSVGSTEVEVRAALTGMGYEVHEIKFEHDEIEAEAVMDGVLYEIEVATRTGLITEVSVEDDEDHDDD